MKTVFVQIEPDQVIKFSNGVVLDKAMVETLRKFQHGYDENNPIDNDFIIDLQMNLVEAGDALHQMNYHGTLSDNHLYTALECLWTVRKALDVFRFK